MSVLDLPIIGDITRGNPRAEQRSAEEFAPLLQAVLNEPGVRSVSWYQRTPYFNDGDPCVFSAYFSSVRMVGQAAPNEDDEDYEEEGEGFPPYSEAGQALIGRWEKGWNADRTVYGYVGEYAGPNKSLFLALDAFSKAIDSGAFDDVLLDKFGDHATVKVVKDEGIYVDYYEHE